MRVVLGIWPLLIVGLTLLFVADKLDGTIDWSWLMVVSPLWLPTVATALAVAGIFAVLCVVALTFIIAAAVVTLITGMFDDVRTRVTRKKGQ